MAMDNNIPTKGMALHNGSSAPRFDDSWPPEAKASPENPSRGNIKKVHARMSMNFLL
jgi:hypothetical protein